MGRCDGGVGHGTCSIKGSWLPKRLLEISDNDKKDSEAPRVRLIESSGLSVKYIALSHCWGRIQSFQTTSANIEEMKRGFQYEDTPATFRDAIIVARLLGVQYLWIDSLCIVQDDLKDWETESAQMAKVYRHAHLTISAARAVDDNDGFLGPRYPIQAPITLNVSWGESVELYMKPYRELGASRQPVDARGWIMQEHWLSRRQLRFEAEEIVWICQNDMRSESLNDNYYWQGYSPRSVETLFRAPEPESYTAWYGMLQEYTARQLSFPSDTFPALAGLASIVAEHDGTNYMAGLWWEDIGRGLCWVTKDKHASSRTSYVAPSWSWASVSSPVSFLCAERRDHWTFRTVLDLCSFHSYSISIPGSNKYGAITDAWIRFRAPVVELRTVREEELTTQKQHGSGNMHDLPHHSPEITPVVENLPKGAVHWTQYTMDSGNQYFQEDMFGVLLLKEEKNYWTSSERVPESVDYFQISGLLIQRSKHSTRRECINPYVRVGFFTLETQRKYKHLFCRNLQEILLE